MRVKKDWWKGSERIKGLNWPIRFLDLGLLWIQKMCRITLDTVPLVLVALMIALDIVPFVLLVLDTVPLVLVGLHGPRQPGLGNNTGGDVCFQRMNQT